MMLLVDIGNSQVKWATAGVDQKQVIRSPYVDAGLNDVIDRGWVSLDRPEAVHVSNVAGLESAEIVREYCLSRWSVEPVFAAPVRELMGLSNAYAEAERLGVDRWLAMLAVWHRLGTGFCLVDCGTSVTIDLVLRDGRHCGGYILPGARLMQEALNRRVPHIRIDAAEPENTKPGANTRDCLIHGAGLAVSAAVDRCARDHRAGQGEDCGCILTGGGAAVVGRLLAECHDCIPDLVLEGLDLVSGAAS